MSRLVAAVIGRRGKADNAIEQLEAKKGASERREEKTDSRIRRGISRSWRGRSRRDKEARACSADVVESSCEDSSPGNPSFSLPHALDFLGGKGPDPSLAEVPAGGE